jgi:adenylylsulfate kinase
LGEEDFIEVHVRCSLEECERRDVKGLYKRARTGEIRSFTGISSPYEVPEAAEVVLETDRHSIEECVEQLVEYLEERAILGPDRESRISSG